MSAQPPTGQLGYKQYHSTVLVDDEVLLWGGYHDGVPMIHDSDDKVPFRTRMNVLNLSNLQWQKTDSTGDPPYGLMNCGSACVGNDVYFFGGRCDHRQSCHSHDNLHVYNAVGKTWKVISCTEGPMEKFSCGFTALGDTQSCLHLLVFGGKGKAPTPLPHHSSYILFEDEDFTNEVHVMDITNSLGKWNVPMITGQRPPPIAWFTMDTIPHNRMQCVLFGGYIVTEKAVGEWTNDIYIVTLCKDSVSFEKISRINLSQWPKCRDTHSSCVVTNTCMTDDNVSHLCIMGGSDGMTINDCWMFDLNTKSWNKLPLPDFVCGRESHSITNYKINANTQWIIIVGGEVGYSQIHGHLVSIVVEIVYFLSLSQWVIKKLWNCTDKWTHSDQWLALQKDMYQAFIINDTPSSASNGAKQPSKVYSLDDMGKKATLTQDDLNTLLSKDSTILQGQSDSYEINEISFTAVNGDRTSKICKHIKDVMDRNHASLSTLFEDSIKEVSESMLSAGIISRIKMKEPSSDSIINSFNAGLNFKTTVQEIENHCVKFLTVVHDFGGPFSDAALSIQTQIIDVISNNLNIQLNLQ